MNNLAQILFEKNAENADRVVFEDNQETVTYAELEHRTRCLATWLIDQGIQPGSRVTSGRHHNFLACNFNWCGKTSR